MPVITHSIKEALPKVRKPSHFFHLNFCYRIEQDFVNMGLPEEIAPMRMQYYEDKRRVYTLQLEDAIKNGIIEAIKTTKNETLPVVR